MARLERRREVELLLERVPAWASARVDVTAVALVGSWARGEEGPGSDVDLVVLTEDPLAYTEGDDWIEPLAPGASLVRTGDWGAVVERRLRLPSGLEVEVGVGRSSWAATAPVDAGTLRVVRDGLRSVHDPRGLLARLLGATDS